jgi:hypothetical protein
MALEIADGMAYLSVKKYIHRSGFITYCFIFLTCIPIPSDKVPTDYAKVLSNRLLYALIHFFFLKIENFSMGPKISAVTLVRNNHKIEILKTLYDPVNTGGFLLESVDIW